MVLNSQIIIRKVVLRCVTGVTPKWDILRGAANWRASFHACAVELVSFVREEHVFEEIRTRRGK